MIDLDDWKWWGLVFHRIVTGVGVTWLTIDRIWEKVRPIEEFVERRYHERRIHNMSMTQIVKVAEEAPQLIGQIITTVNDAKKVLAELQANPDAQKVLADITAIEAQIKAIIGQ